jgi:predicted 2-oxoglutarate/Fe(II)-dependent dioxygenase YbiX
MSDTTPRNSERADDSAMGTVMPPYLVIGSFLEEDTVAGLLDFALGHEHSFEPTKVGRASPKTIKPKIRVSLGMRDLGPFKPILKSKMLALVPDLVAKLKTPAVNTPQLELQLVAHGDGAFYKRHIDTHTVPDRESIRVLSGVYYFHSHPKAFTGGALRLYAIGDPAMATFVDIEPEHNTLLVFPSWIIHEVMPVSCPSHRFVDSRFAINCWIYRSKPEA